VTSRNSDLRDLAESWASLIHDKLLSFHDDELTMSVPRHRDRNDREDVKRLQQTLVTSLEECLLEKKIFESVTGLAFVHLPLTSHGSSERCCSKGLWIELIDWVTETFSSLSSCQWSVIWSSKILTTSFSFTHSHLTNHYLTHVDAPDLYSKATSSGEPGIQRIVSPPSSSSSQTDVLESIVYLPVLINGEVLCTLQGIGRDQEMREERWRWYLEAIQRICRQRSLSVSSGTTDSVIVSNECVSLFKTFAEQMLLPVSDQRTISPSDYYSSLIEVLSLALANSLSLNIGIIFDAEESREDEEAVVDRSDSDEEDDTKRAYACYISLNESPLSQLPSHR
jgi:hypothetical protein